MDEETALREGDRIVVLTPDRRSFTGTLLEIRRSGGRPEAVVRLDTGWVTAYPLTLVHRRDQ